MKFARDCRSSESNEATAQLLFEALPWIKNLTGKTVVIKYGGAAMVDEQLRRDVMSDIVLLKIIGMRPVIVHGGGKAINEALSHYDIPVEFKNGQSVTTPATMDIVREVLGGKVNQELVAALNHHGNLAVGVSGAKALAWAANKPIYGINHVIGHIAVTQLQFGPFPKDTLALIVSGGHTSLLHVEDMPRKIDVVGTTLDDAAGECFDKVARLLGFPYPGGPHIDRHGQNGDPHAIKVPMGLTQGKAGAAHPYDFSFSGVKTAVARWVESEQAAGHEIPVDDVCASLADSVATVLARKAMRGCRQYDSNTLIVGGGFSANSQLRAKLLEFGENYGVDVRIPQIKLCTDNGAMVAMLGVNLVEAGVAPSAPDFPIDSAMPLTKVSM